MTPQAAANNLLRLLDREIYGIPMEKLPEAVGIVEDALDAYAKQRVEQAELLASTAQTQKDLKELYLRQAQDAEAKVSDLEREREIADIRIGTLQKMLRYIAFVLTGNEDSDAQVAADNSATKLTEMREALAGLFSVTEQRGDAAKLLAYGKAQRLLADQ